MSTIETFFGLRAVPGAIGRLSVKHGIHSSEMTGLRGLAIMIVVFGHLLQRVQRFDGDNRLLGHEKEFFAIFATPFTGCCIFFCISGYTLMAFLQSTTRINKPILFQYVLRRFLRLCPPYFLVLIITYAFLLATGYNPVGSRQFFAQPASLSVSLIASLLLVHDLAFGTFPRIFPPGWFIETQFQFYLIGPALWIFYLKLRPGGLRLFLGTLFVIIAMFFSFILTDYIRIRNLDYSVAVFLPYFCVGALAADFKLNCSARISKYTIIGKSQMGWWSIAALILLGESLESDILTLTARIICLALILVATFSKHTNFQRVLVDRWVTRVGVACYSIYLVHLQLLHLLTPLVMRTFNQLSVAPLLAICCVCELPFIIGFSAVFYWLVERPCVAATRLVAAEA